MVWSFAPLFLFAQEVSSVQPADGTAVVRPVVSSGPARLSGPGIVAHRSKARGYPENSLSGLEKVLSYGVDYIEVDVRTTSDGVLVVHHDGDLKRTTRSKGLLKEWTFAGLQEQVILRRKRHSPKGERIPTLEQVCELLARHNRLSRDQGYSGSVNLYVDCKDAAPDALLRILQQYHLAEGAVFYGGDGYLKRLKEIFPEARIIPGLRDLSDMDAKIAGLDPYGFDVKWGLLDRHTVQQIHAKGQKIYTDLLFIHDHSRNYRKAKRWGVDVIQTDRARKAQRVLRDY